MVIFVYANFIKLISVRLHELGIKKVKIEVALDSKVCFTAKNFIEYLINKVKIGYGFAEVFMHAKRCLNLFLYLHNIGGYKVCFAGRFSRKQIATYRWDKEGSVPYSDMGESIDYSFGWDKTRHGVYSMKVWLKIKNRAITKRTIKLRRK